VFHSCTQGLGCVADNPDPDRQNGCSWRTECTQAGRQTGGFILYNVYVEFSATYNVGLITDDVKNRHTYIRITLDVLVFRRKHLQSSCCVLSPFNSPRSSYTLKETESCSYYHVYGGVAVDGV
jgi:hypothetical protein